jgi:isopentenyl phosphate kinase
MNNLLFLKLGGSLLTDKTEKEALRRDTLARIAAEIASARAAQPDLALVLGHGSGSFGHVAAAKHNTRHGVHSPAEWLGFAEVNDAAARLNRHVIQALLEAGVPAIGLSPMASAQVEDGRIVVLAVQPVEAALHAGLVPVVYGDVAFDTVRGGTIISTEEIMTFLAGSLHPSWFLLAGETEGVLDGQSRVVPSIHRRNLAEIQPALGGSRGTDVTGGMAAKVLAMLSLVEQRPEMSIRIFSGLEAGLLSRLLLNPAHPAGTCLRYT